MAFFKVKTDEENVKDYSGDGGKWINKSGMYDIVLKAVTVNSSAKGSEYLNLWLEYQGQEQTVYLAMRITNTDGSPNLGQKLFNKLCIVSGATEGADIGDPVSRMIPMGKGGEEVECMVLEEFDNVPITMRVQMEYSMYNGEVQESKSVRNFFRFEDKATASEIVNNSDDKGKQFAIEQEQADRITYRDGLTEEDIAEWRKNRSSGKKQEASTPKQGFGQKRTFGKK